jgi:protein-disulfide isomerase
MTKKIKTTKVIIIALSLIVVILLGMMFINRGANETNEKLKKYTQSSNFQGVNYLGDLDAPVKIIEYSSITCIFCKRYSIEDGTFQKIKEEYIDTGKVLYGYKHFTRNQIDILGARAMECAGEQDMFFEYKELIYKNQNQLQNLEFEKYAKELNLDLKEFDECVEKEDYFKKIEEDKNEAILNGITGTPGFLINGKIVSGAQADMVFKEIIEEEL